MRAYLDTNVLVAYFKPKDQYHFDSKIILNQAKIRKVVSFLTLIEFSSVIFRLQKGGQIEFTSKMKEIISKIPQKHRAIVLSKYIVKKFNLNVLGAKELLNFKINDKAISFPLEFLKALSLSCELGLKTLDNLHIAIVALENRVSRIDYFVTGDSDVINKRKIVLKVAGCPVLTPSEFTSLLGLRH